MNKTNWYTLYVLFGGFGLLELFTGTPEKSGIWFLLLALAMGAKALLEKKVLKKEKESPMVSGVTPEQKQALQENRLPQAKAEGIVLRKEEVCHLQVPAALDFYDMPQGTLTLTNQRVLYSSSAQHFTSEWSAVEFKKTRRGFEMKAGKRKMPFICADGEEICKLEQIIREQYDIKVPVTQETEQKKKTGKGNR